MEQAENPIEDLRGLEWQVNIRQHDLYYVGRGRTPTQALVDLTASIEKGLAHAEEQVDAFRKRYDALKQALADVQKETE